MNNQEDVTYKSLNINTRVVPAYLFYFRFSDLDKHYIYLYLNRILYGVTERRVYSIV